MKHRAASYSFEILFISLIILIVIPPSLHLSSGLWVKIFLTMILFASLYMLKFNSSLLTIGSVIAGLALLLSWGQIFLELINSSFYLSIVYICFFGFICFNLMRFLIRCKRADENVIFAAMCLYIFLSNLWMFIYTLIYTINPEAFAFSQQFAVSEQANFFEILGVFSYYSFVTLTTLGYGDISPIGEGARAWVSVESMIGQFYIAIILAKLVAISVETD